MTSESPNSDTTSEDAFEVTAYKGPRSDSTEEATACRSDAAQYANESYTHIYRPGDDVVVCETDTRGHATPGGRSPVEIVVDASEGYIPLWAPNVTLRWRFQPQSMELFVDPDSATDYLRWLFGQGLMAWGDAVPIRFTEANDAWDFEIAVNPTDRCNSSGGCTLARAFFPDAGRHDLLLYPKMFEQTEQEQAETMAHELGHVFGLRHFFAPVSETEWASRIFGTHSSFSIMNYGDRSVMTQADRDDLAELYQAVWSGALTNINGTPVRLVRPFSAARVTPPDCVPVSTFSPISYV
ncbi:MAG: reprolysin-like metallopeptidase [Acidimicrobiales bacterium]